MSTTFRSGETLRAAKLNRLILQQAAQASELAAFNVLGGAVGQRPDRWGTVDRTGTRDNAAILNDASERCIELGDPLWLECGQYRLNSSLWAKSGTNWNCDAAAEFVAYFNSTGPRGIVTLTDADRTAAGSGTLQSNIKIRGGIWRRDGYVDPNNNAAWIGYGGNVFSFVADFVELRDMVLPGWTRGRAFLIGGHHWLLDRVDALNIERDDLSSTNRAGGTGAFRWQTGGPFIATRCRGVCGDDVFQAVSGVAVGSGEDMHDITYSDCWGVSYNARLMVVGMSDPDDTGGTFTMSAKNITFRGIRGHGLAEISNRDSTGVTGPILFDDCWWTGIKPDETGGVANPLEISGSAATGGMDLIHIRDCGFTRVKSGGVLVTGSNVRHVRFTNWRQPEQEDPASVGVKSPIRIQDAELVEFIGGQVDGASGSPNSVVMVGSAPSYTEVKKAVFRDFWITGIEAGLNGIHGSTNGYRHLEMHGGRMQPASGVTTAQGVRCSDIAVTTTLNGVDLSEVGTDPVVNFTGTCTFTNVRWPAGAGNGILYQQTQAATSIDWDGRCKMIRLMSSGAITVSTVTVPSGLVPESGTTLRIMGGNSNVVTFNTAGNLRPAAGSSSINLADVATFVWDAFGSVWRQAAYSDN